MTARTFRCPRCDEVVTELEPCSEHQMESEADRLYEFVSTQMRAGMTLGFFNPDDEQWLPIDLAGWRWQPAKSGSSSEGLRE